LSFFSIVVNYINGVFVGGQERLGMILSSISL